MKIVDDKEFGNAIKLKGKAGRSTSRFLMNILRIKRLNKYYSEIYHLPGKEFLNETLSMFRIKYEVSEDDIKRIPKEGAFIAISNHPYGGIDGIIMIKIFTDVRPDFKVMANFLLQRIKPLEEFFLPVNNFENQKDIKSSYTGIRLALKHINENKPLGIFPAGEVSTFQTETNTITDKKWLNSALRIIKKAEVPVVPVYFQGTNSRLFHLLGMIHPLLRTAKLPSELLNKKNKLIKVRIGNPIPVKDLEEFTDIERFGRFLRAKTYALGTSLEVKKFFKPQVFRVNKEEKIVDPVDQSLIIKEINNLPKEDLLFRNKNYNVYCTAATNIPNVLTEIGRLRELTFREVGEGTNKSIDIDEFDLYYHQLFIWDTEKKLLVGAYRVGKGREILHKYGQKGFYIQTLFRLKKSFNSILNESLELGRSFIVKEYQRQILPLFLLWKGILYFLLKNPEYRYLIGPVSISNRFSKLSKGLIIEFIKKNFYDEQLAKLVVPRKKFHVEIDNDIDTDIFLEKTNNDMNKLDKLIEDIELSSYKMPVLLKKYIKLNAKIIGFNIDPKFNNALDGLMILDLFDVPAETIEALSKEINDKSILERFYKTGLFSDTGEVDNK
ncbi:MAG: lysophospholipid acyltransferase family protein [Marinilabiliales bacterium]